MLNWMKAGLVVLALSVAACGSSANNSTGTGGTGGATGTGGTSGTGGGGGAGGTGGSNPDGGGNSDGGGGDGGPTAQQINDMLMNATTTGGLQVTTPAPSVTYPICQ
jgi:hypothetical protein